MKMSKWNSAILSDAVELVIDYRGKTPKKLGSDWCNDGYRALSAKNIKTGQIVQEDTIRYVDEELYHKWMKEEIKKGDIIVTSEAPFGQIYYWDSDEKIVLSQRLFAIRIKKEFDARYIYQYMTTPLFYEEMSARATGTTVIGLRQPELMKCKIKYPNIEIQKKISAILCAIDRKINNNMLINDNLLQQAQAIFSKYYAVSTEQKPFTELISVLGGGTPKTGNSNFWNGFIPFFTPRDVGTPYTFQTEKYITESGLDHCNSRLYPKNTSFVTARGTVGKVSLAGIPMAMNQSCYALASKTVDPILVYFYVLEAVASLKHKASGAVFDAIVTRDFDTEIINVLNTEDSKIVLAIISPMMGTIHNNIKENIQLSSLRDSLLLKLMSGELDVSSINI